MTDFDKTIGRRGDGSGRCAWVVGSINRDIVGYVERHGQPGETVLGQRSAEFPGGKGANQAVALARLGADVRLVGQVGNDAFGAVMQRFLADEGVGTAGIAVTGDAPTGIALIVVDARSENVITVLPGANMAWADGLDAAAFKPRAGDIVSAQLEIPVPVIRAAFAAARVAGAMTVLNPSPYAATARDLLALSDMLVVNAVELAQMASPTLAPGDVAEIAAAGRSLLAQGPRVAVVTRGALGAVVITADGEHVVPGIAVAARDTTGAGDCFTGAMIAEMLGGADISSAVEFAVRAAAVSVTRNGAAASYPRRRDIV